MSAAAKRRQMALKKLLSESSHSTQEELRERLEAQDFEVTQSTISRDLRRIGATRFVESDGRTVYRLPESSERVPLPTGELSEHVIEIRHNGTLIVIQTIAGSASMIARHIDQARPGGVIGTIAGDDTVFVAPPSDGSIEKTVTALENSFH